MTINRGVFRMRVIEACRVPLSVVKRANFWSFQVRDRGIVGGCQVDLIKNVICSVSCKCLCNTRWQWTSSMTRREVCIRFTSMCITYPFKVRRNVLEPISSHSIKCVCVGDTAPGVHSLKAILTIPFVMACHNLPCFAIRDTDTATSSLFNRLSCLHTLVYVPLPPGLFRPSGFCLLQVQ